MRYIGIDYGKKRIGVAASESGIIARPLSPIENRGDKKNLCQIIEICKRYDFNTICGVVCIGIPLYRDGGESEMSMEARKFGEFLHDELGLTIVFHNEYHSSVDAEKYIRGIMGITNRDKVKELVDSVAAAVILQSYIDSLESSGGE